MLGFIEGEGSFLIHTRGIQLVFAIGQAEIDLALMEAIKVFLNKLPAACTEKGQQEAVSLTFQNQTQNHNMCFIRITNLNYIRNVLIPFFDNLI